jgi:hypothetical protein
MALVNLEKVGGMGWEERDKCDQINRKFVLNRKRQTRYLVELIVLHKREMMCEKETLITFIV